MPIETDEEFEDSIIRAESILTTKMFKQNEKWKNNQFDMLPDLEAILASDDIIEGEV
ncbi:MAG: hypothetical protein U9O53_01385 [archaeon]|nr:hypothetical protein [archaeon]